MLLHFIFISVVVCTVEISEFHSDFLCLSRLLENLSAVLLDACDNFSFPFVVVSFSMPQIRGSCGHLKGGYDNHPSCIIAVVVTDSTVVLCATSGPTLLGLW